MQESRKNPPPAGLRTLARLPNRGVPACAACRLVLAGLSFLLAALPRPGFADTELDAAFERDVLIVAAGRFACHRLDVYLAQDDTQRARGLMHVRELAPTTGMLFVYDRDGYLSMWMKNTYIALDMVFARRDGTIAAVVHDTEPLSLRSIVAEEPVRYVLELNAGTTERLVIGKQSRLLWRDTHDSER